jgi:hypothetical protein
MGLFRRLRNSSSSSRPRSIKDPTTTSTGKHRPFWRLGRVEAQVPQKAKSNTNTKEPQRRRSRLQPFRRRQAQKPLIEIPTATEKTIPRPDDTATMSSQPITDEEAVAAADKEMEARANRAKELLSQRYVGLKRQQVRYIALAQFNPIRFQSIS